MKFLYEHDEQLPKYIAALYYQIEPSKAIEVAYLDNLRKALDTGKTEEVKEISALPTFDDLLENAITSVANVPNAVTALNDCGVSIAKRFWDSLYSKITTRESSLQDYQLILINNITEAKVYTKRIVTEFYNSTIFDAYSYHQSIERLIKNKTTDPTPYLQQKTIEPQAFVEYVRQVKEHYNDYQIKCNENELDEYLSKLEIQDLQQLSIIPFIFANYSNLDSYKQHLEELIDNNVGNLETVSVCYKLLKEIANEKPIKKQLTAQQIYTLFNNCDDTNDFRYDLVAMRLAQFSNLQIVPNTNKISTYLRSTDELVINKVAAVIEYYTTFGEILTKASKISNQELLKEIAVVLTKETDRNSMLNLLPILQQYNTIKQYLGLEAETIIVRLNDWDATADITPNIVNTIPLLFFMDIAENNIKNDLTSHCIAQYTAYLNAISTEDWEKHIADEDTEYQMLQYIGKNRVQNCFDAFKALLVSKAVGDDDILSTDKRDYLLKLAEYKGCSLKVAFNNVKDKFRGGTATMSNEQFQYFGELLLKYATLTDDTTTTLRTIFPNILFENSSNVSLIIKYKDILQTVYDKADEEDKKDFINKLQTLIDGQYKDKDKAPQGFEDFANAFGVTKTTLIEGIMDGVKSIFKKE